jgi:hypothetical protein
MCRQIAGKITAFALVLFTAEVIFSQVPTGEITGTVRDSSGAVIPDASVTLLNTSTNATRATKTNNVGIFDLPALTPGNYTLTIEMQGFSTQVRNNIDLQVAQVANFDTVLQAGAVTERVEVTGGAPVLETESTAVGTVIDNQRIVELPLNGRNYLSLTALTPGVSNSTPPPQTSAQRQGGLRGTFVVSANGQRVVFNHFTLDGAENTDPNFNTYFFLPSLDSLQEFKVETGITPAEYGHNMTQVNVTSRSGGNAFHGTLFEFIRNSAVDARNYFDRKTLPIPPFKRNQFGGTLGGPIVKNKLFFFFDYEGLRERKALTRVGTVPSAAWRSGNFQGTSTIYDPATRVFKYDANGNPLSVVSVTPFQNNTIPDSSIHRVTAAYLAGWVPLPNVGTATAANNFITALVQPTNNDQEFIRVDYLQTQNVNWLFRFSRTNELQSVPSSIVPGVGLTTNSHATQGVLGNTFLIGANRVNDFKLVVNNLSNLLPSFNANKKNVVAQLGVNQNFSTGGYPTPNPFYWGVPSASATGLTLPGDGGGDFAYWDGFGQVGDNFSWIKGRHTIKFGAELGRTRYNGINGTYASGIFNATGVYTTNSLTAPSTANAFADLLLGDFGLTSGLFGEQIFNLRWWYVGTYIEDSWKLTPKLTVNVGLRWEDQTPPTDKNDDLVNLIYRWDNSITPYFCRAGNGDFYANSQGFLAPAGVPLVRNGTCNNVFDNDPFNFAPRLGVAWSMNPKTVIRTGAGTFFVHEISNSFLELDRNLPNSLIEKASANPVFPNLTWDHLFPTPATPSYTSGTERHVPTERIYQWNLGIQRELYRNASLEANYVGSAGNYLWRINSYNTAPPGPGSVVTRSPFPQFGGGVQVTQPAVHSHYHSLQVRFEQRFSHGFTLLSSFSYSKSLDSGSSYRPISTDGEFRDPGNPGDHQGRSAFDFTRRWATSFVYELPFGKGRAMLNNANPVLDGILGGWQLAGIYTMQDGLPLSAFCTNVSTFQNGGNSTTQPTNCYPDVVLGQSPNQAQGNQDPGHGLT